MRRQFVVVIFLMLLGLSACVGAEIGRFGPTLIEPTPIGTISLSPIALSFTELNSDPYIYRNKLVRMTGTFDRLTPDACTQENGLVAYWSLIDEGLRLDNVGQDSLANIIPDETVITVDGIWRLYEGPLGCGKEPEDGFYWYLETAQIVQPNPLPLKSNQASTQEQSISKPAIKAQQPQSAIPTATTQRVLNTPVSPLISAPTLAATATPNQVILPTNTASAPTNESVIVEEDSVEEVEESDVIIPEPTIEIIELPTETPTPEIVQLPTETVEADPVVDESTPTETPSATETPVATETATPTLEATETATATPTAEPTETMTPEPTATEESVATVTATYPPPLSTPVLTLEPGSYPDPTAVLPPTAYP